MTRPIPPTPPEPHGVLPRQGQAAPGVRRRSLAVALAGAALAGAVLAPTVPVAAGAQNAPSPAVAISATHPRFWSLDGRTALLLGGSREDNLFQIPDLAEHLDTLVAAGGNYVRCTLSSRDPGDEWPFHFDAERGAYDLDRWNEAYWDRLERFLAETARRGVVVQVEVWATFDFYREPWERNPFNPQNNLNYTAERTRLPTAVPTHPTWTRNPFFRSVPDHDNNAPVLAYQQRFVDRLLQHTLRYGHVLYCMDNETSVTASWGRFWATYIRKKAAERGRRVFTTEMWDPWDLGHVMHRETFDHPEIYDFVDISQNNHQRGQAHWENAVRLLERLERAGLGRPANNVKTYGADGGRHGGGTDEGVAKLVRSALLGSAAVRFHRPPSGLGLSETARRAIRGVRELSDRMPWFDASPHQDLLGEREENEAYCRALPGEAYAVYFPAGGRVTLDVSAIGGDAELVWLDLLGAGWGEAVSRPASDELVLEAPGAHRLALVSRAGTR